MSDPAPEAVEVGDETLLARAYLSRVAEPSSVPVWALVRAVGPVEAATLIKKGRVSEPVRAATDARRDRVDPGADLEAGARHGIRLVVPESTDWPHAPFAALERAGHRRLHAWEAGERKSSESGELIPPLALWVRGRSYLASIGYRSAAIVGSRAATAYGQHMAAELAYDLARTHVTVISGGAYGIDAAAHRGALAADGVTVIVSAGGADRPYPAGNAALFDQAVVNGLIIAESPPGSAPHRRRFLTRNRLIAALASGTVVVEAAHRSGALNTAAHARGLGRPVMAVPGPVTSAMSAGCHQLLRHEGAGTILVESGEDVLAVVGSAGEGLGVNPRADSSVSASPSDRDARSLRRALDQLDPQARAVFDGLPTRRWVDEDRLAALSGVTVMDVIRALPVLQLAGLVESSQEGHRIIQGARAGGA